MRRNAIQPEIVQLFNTVLAAESLDPAHPWAHDYFALRQQRAAAAYAAPSPSR